MRLLHELSKISARFDDPHLVSQAGLVPVMALAQRAGLEDLAGKHVRISRPCGVNAQGKIGCLVAGMIAGADSIGDMDLLRYGALPGLFGGVRAPSTLGSFLRSLTWGNVLQAQKVHREFLAELARCTRLLPGAGTLAFPDIGSQQKRVCGHHKQGAAFGHTKIQGKSGSRTLRSSRQATTERGGWMASRCCSGDRLSWRAGTRRWPGGSPPRR